ncbi:MAG TPA: hypothetical protein VFP20_09670 [Bacteroidales bacterium]|nr:hypothetical protein [Bacteroidales bacterium]
MKRAVILIFLIVSCILGLMAQEPNVNENGLGTFKGGVRIQKAQKLYWENGFAFDYSSPKLLDSRIHLGASYCTTRLGSAIASNAIKQDHYLLSAAYHFRPKKQLQPFVRLNSGYFHADLESPIFDVLPNNAFLASIDAGLCYEFKFPLTLTLSTGYNLNVGTGVRGPGTLYPVFYQMSIFYTIF